MIQTHLPQQGATPGLLSLHWSGGSADVCVPGHGLVMCGFSWGHIKRHRLSQKTTTLLFCCTPLTIAGFNRVMFFLLFFFVSLHFNFSDRNFIKALSSSGQQVWGPASPFEVCSWNLEHAFSAEPWFCWEFCPRAVTLVLESVKFLKSSTLGPFLVPQQPFIWILLNMDLASFHSTWTQRSISKGLLGIQTVSAWVSQR